MYELQWRVLLQENDQSGLHYLPMTPIYNLLINNTEIFFFYQFMVAFIIVECLLSELSKFLLLIILQQPELLSELLLQKTTVLCYTWKYIFVKHSLAAILYSIVLSKYLYICIHKYGPLVLLTPVSLSAGVMTEPTIVPKINSQHYILHGPKNLVLRH